MPVFRLFSRDRISGCFYDLFPCDDLSDIIKEQSFNSLFHRVLSILSSDFSIYFFRCFFFLHWSIFDFIRNFSINGMITNRSLMKNAEIIQYPAKLKNANINMIALPFHLLDRCPHGAFAVADELVGTVGENLVAFQFGQFEVRRVNNGTAL